MKSWPGINEMPSVVRSTVLNMYAYDTTVYTADKCPTQVAQCLTNELQHLSTWCQAIHLRINPVKTTAMFLCRGRLQRCGNAKIYLEGHPLENKSVTNYFGVTIDSQLTFRQHVARVTSKAYRVLKTLCHVKASLPTVTRILLYRTLVLPHLEYCSAIWDPHTAELTSKVERVQNRAILDKPPRIPSDSLRQQLKWQTLEERRKLHCAKLTGVLKSWCPTHLHTWQISQEQWDWKSRWQKSLTIYMWSSLTLTGSKNSLVSRPSPVFCSSVFKYVKAEEREKRGRPWNTYHVMTSGGREVDVEKVGSTFK